MKKNVLLIGESSTIGKSIKKVLIKESYNIYGTTSKSLDLSSEDSVNRFIEKNKKTKFDHIIFLAAINNPTPFTELSREAFEDAYSINFKSFIYLLKSLIDNIPKNQNSTITLISSLYGVVGRKNRFLYSTSKHFLNGAMKTLAIELAPYSIRVNCVSPGYVDTRMTKKNNNKVQLKKIINKIPMSRLGRPKEIANVVSFLISNNASYITGQNIIVDGGVMAGGFWAD